MEAAETVRHRSEYVGLVVIPLITLAVLVSSSLWALNPDHLVQRLGLGPGLICQMREVRTDKPAADVLIMGTSRTGAGIDPPVVAATMGLNDADIERLAEPGQSVINQNMTYQTYTKNRGVPAVLALQLMIGQRPVDINTFNLGPNNRTVTLFETGVYRNMLHDLRTELGAGPESSFVTQRLWSSPGFALQRLDAGFTALHHRITRNAKSPPQCTQKETSQFGRWRAGDSKPFDSETARKPSEREVAKMQRQVARYVDFEISRPETQDALAVVAATVNQAQRDGVEHIVLFYLPSFEETANVMDLTAIADRIPNATIFDARPVVQDAERPLMAFQFRDRNHLNRTGAYEVSVAIAEFLGGLDP